jgi:hypothetical protein
MHAKFPISQVRASFGGFCGFGGPAVLFPPIRPLVAGFGNHVGRDVVAPVPEFDQNLGMRWVWVGGSTAFACAGMAAVLAISNLETLSWIAGVGSFVATVPSVVLAMVFARGGATTRAPAPAPAAVAPPVAPRNETPVPGGRTENHVARQKPIDTTEQARRERRVRITKADIGEITGICISALEASPRRGMDTKKRIIETRLTRSGLIVRGAIEANFSSFPERAQAAMRERLTDLGFLVSGNFGEDGVVITGWDPQYYEGAQLTPQRIDERIAELQEIRRQVVEMQEEPAGRSMALDVQEHFGG